MEQLIAIVALILTGPLVGVEFGVAAITNPLTAKLPDDAFRTVRSGGSRLLGALMPFWYIGTFVALILVAVLSRDALVIAAAAVMAAAVVLSVTVLVPINNRIGKWESDSDVSRDLANRWDRFHWLRVAMLAVMFVLLAVGVMT